MGMSRMHLQLAYMLAFLYVWIASSACENVFLLLIVSLLVLILVHVVLW